MGENVKLTVMPQQIANSRKFYQEVLQVEWKKDNLNYFEIIFSLENLGL